MVGYPALTARTNSLGLPKAFSLLRFEQLADRLTAISALRIRFLRIHVAVGIYVLAISLRSSVCLDTTFVRKPLLPSQCGQFVTRVVVCIVLPW